MSAKNLIATAIAVGGYATGLAIGLVVVLIMQAAG